MAKILNKNYRQFLDQGVISTLSEADIKAALDNCTGKHKIEAQALVICMYYTGGRPSEILELKAKDIYKDKSYCVVQLKGTKGGLPRPIYLQSKRPLVGILYKYAMSIFPEMYLFWHFRTKYTRRVMTKKGIKEYESTADGLRYYFRKWFRDVNPYFLRHNRFSKLSEKGATIREIKHLKGAKSIASCEPYVHLSTSRAKSLARMND